MRLRTRSRAWLFSTVALAAGVAATLGYSFTPAVAQGFFFWGGDSLPRAAPPREQPKHVARPRHAGGKKASSKSADKTGAKPGHEAKADAPQLDRPLFLIASIADQHVSIYNHNGLVVRSAISTGMAGHPTPKGIFSIIGRERFHRSNIYSSAPMPFMQRITWSGIAMHLGVVPGHPASHGCIRLPAAFAAKLWGMTRIGERVVIAPHEVTPVEFDHALLPQPKLRTSAEAEKGGSGTQVAAEAPTSIAPQPQAEKPELKTGGDAVDSAKADADADQRPSSPAVAEARAAEPEPVKEQPKAEASEPAAAAKAESAAVAPQEAPVAAVAPADDLQRQAEQPKVEAAAADKAEPSAGASPSAVAEQPMVNPRQYAQQLKAKAVAEVVATAKAVKALTIEVGTKQKEAARAAAELNAAEASQIWARNKADAAAASYDAATASAASQQEPAATAERDASSGDDARAKAKANRLTTAYGRALLIQDALLLRKTNADSVLAEATAKLEQARTASSARESEFAEADRRLIEARTAAAAAVAAQKEAERRTAPISMLISKKQGRIYVRQGLAPLFDAPIEIRDPKTPLGSHLYIATAASDDGKSLKWQVISVPVRLGDELGAGRKTASNEAGLSWSLRTTTSPTEALERVDIPKEVRDRIAERLWTGASLIISDQPVSSETGAVGTDLTIKLR